MDNSGLKKYFRHVRNGAQGYGTLCVVVTETGDFSAGASLCHPNDAQHFCRKLGREIAFGRAKARLEGENVCEIDRFGEMCWPISGNNIEWRSEMQEEARLQAESNWKAVQNSLRVFVDNVQEARARAAAAREQENTAGSRNSVSQPG